jgi:hypothetical protein
MGLLASKNFITSRFGSSSENAFLMFSNGLPLGYQPALVLLLAVRNSFCGRSAASKEKRRKGKTE